MNAKFLHNAGEEFCADHPMSIISLYEYVWLRSSFTWKKGFKFRVDLWQCWSIHGDGTLKSNN